MELKLYDTLTKEKRVFTPLDKNNVRMYVCGPTVYDFAHIGNARPVIVFDVLFRLLRHLYGESHVTYVRNITDVDDKINDRAARDFPGMALNDAIRKVTEKTANQFHADVAALGCLAPTHEPRATDFVLPRADGKADMTTLIKQLIARGHAYEAGGEVLFDTSSMKDYGALSGRKLEDQLAGARVAVDAHKKNPADFVLWKQSSPDEPGWESPWGRGRPGWHIECSAMSAAYLGDVFDIHGGGLDLIFPHHENELAQSRCAHGTPTMANYWMHNGFLEVEGKKMSKSLGNFVTINDFFLSWHGFSWPGEALRFNMLRTSYRQPIDWTLEGLDESHKILWDWYEDCKSVANSNSVPTIILEPLCDDLNTPAMITSLHVLKRERRYEELLASLKLLGFSGDKSKLQRSRNPLPPSRLPPFVDTSSFDVAAQTVINIDRQRQSAAIQATTTGGTFPFPPSADAKIKDLIDARAAARARKDFAESDRIRDELAAMGVAIKDSKDADGKPVTTWEIAR
jgi:cysteinyl-tRNA synthetase